MKSPYQPYRGVRDFYPEALTVRDHIFRQWQAVVERHGYQRYDASVLEYLDLYAAKPQANQEILQEQIYVFADRGGRQVALRPEMTPTLARMIVARQQELNYPIRWYSLPNLWRYERPQRGRLREHWQLNVDLFGIADSAAEFELILIVQQILQSFGATDSMYQIRLNSRDLVDDILTNLLKLNDDQRIRTTLLLDRYHKLESKAFQEATWQIFAPDTGRYKTVIKFLEKLVNLRQLSDLPASITDQPAAQRLQGLFDSLQAAQINNWILDLTVVRGFNYYTGIVFEVFDNHKDNRRSMFGGGRYDHLLEDFGGQALTAVGFGMGDVTLLDFVRLHKLLPTLGCPFDVYIILLPDVGYGQILPILKTFWSENLKVFVDNRQLKPAKKITAALKRGATYVLFIGSQDLEDSLFNLKHLPTQKEQRLSLARVVSKLAATQPP